MALNCSQRIDAHRILHRVNKAIKQIDSRKKTRVARKGEVLFYETNDVQAYAQYNVYVHVQNRAVRLVIYYEEELFDYVYAELMSRLTVEQKKTPLKSSTGWEAIVTQPHSHR